MPTFDTEIFGAFPYPVLLIADNGMVQYAGEAAARLLGIPRDELAARSWAGLDAHLTLIAWKSTWRDLRARRQVRYATDLVMGNDLLRPICVNLIALDEKRAVAVLEDRQRDDARNAQLDLVSRRYQTGTFRYDHLLGHWHLSPTFLELIGWEISEGEVVLTEEVFREKLEATLTTANWEIVDRELIQCVEEQATCELEVLLNPGARHQRLLLSVVPLGNALHTVQLIGTLSTLGTAADAGTTDAGLARFTLDRAGELIAWVRRDGGFAYANHAFLEYTGVTRADLPKTKATELLAPDREIDLDLLWRKLKDRKTSEGEVAVRNRGGNTSIMGYRVQYLAGPEEDKEALACIYLRDLTFKHQRDENLKLAQFTTDHAPDMIFWTRPDRSITYANRTVSEKLGIPLDELQAMSVVDIAPYFDETARDAFWQRLREHGHLIDEFPIHARDGSIIHTEVSVNLLNFKGEEFACSHCRDITEQKKRRLRGDLLESTLDSVRDLVVWLRPDGSIPYANRQFFKKIKYEPDELTHLRGPNFFTEESWHFLNNNWEALRAGEECEDDVVMKHKEGKLKTLRATLHYIKFQAEEYLSVYLRDQSRKQKRDLQLKLSYGALEAAEEVVVWLKESGEVEYLNQAMIGYIGKTKADWQGQQLRRVFPQLKLEQVVPGTSMEYSMPSQEGHTVYLELTFSAIEQEDHRFLVIIGRNFTERYLRRKQIDEAQRKIEELSARLQEENVVLREEVSSGQSVDNIITVSEKYQRVLGQISQVADADTTVLILGETGTGKELLARSVHELSNRSEKTLIKLNCAALPENLIESELFGHEQGAFTGAHARKRGRFELAHRGTIFLDEVGELPLALQAKLLRVLQEGEFERVGGAETIKVDVRLIAATNRSLEEMVRVGRFRADLYYRLNVFPIVNIPLRERPEDIPVLAQFFARRFAQRQGKEITQINATDLKALQRYRFPGNVRELENIVERAVVLCKTETLRIQLDAPALDDRLEDTAFVTFDEMQRDYIIKALKRTDGRITGPEGAGRLLGLNDRTLMSKMRKFDIQKKEYLV